MYSALFMVLGLLLAGQLARRFKRFPENAADVLNRFIIDICLPATILRVVPNLTFDIGLLALIVTPWAIAATSYVISGLLARALGWDAKSRTLLFLLTSLGNTSFLGFPLCSALLGEASLPLAAVYDQIGSFLLLSVIVPIAIGRITSGARPTAREVALKVVSFPPFFALMFSLLPITLPGFIAPLLTACAAPLVPLAMFSVGFKLPLTRPTGASILGWGLGLKLIVLPLLSWGFLWALGAPPLILQVGVLETAMPTMITVGAVIMAAGIAPELVAAMVGWGLLLSLVTVPAWAWVLRL
jgi:malate permease and related proteins